MRVQRLRKEELIRNGDGGDVSVDKPSFSQPLPLHLTMPRRIKAKTKAKTRARTRARTNRRITYHLSLQMTISC